MVKAKAGYGLMGFGNIGRLHLMALKNLPLLNILPENSVEFISLLTTSSVNKEELAGRLGCNAVVDTINDLLDMPGLDIVDICTPNFLHREQAVAAAARGKHVYCEKPLALDVNQGKEMLESVKKNGVKHQIAFVLRYLPAVARTRAVLKSGILGQVYNVRAEFYHSSYLHPEKMFAWRLSREKAGGGVLVDLGSHLLDLLLFIFDEIKGVQAWTKTVISKRLNSEGELQEVDVDDWALLFLLLSDDIKASLEVSRLALGKEGLGISVYCEKGVVHMGTNYPIYPQVYSPYLKEICWDDYQDDYLSRLLECYPEEKLSGGWLMDTHTASLAWFLKTIFQSPGWPTNGDFHSGLAVQRILEIAYKSARNKGQLMDL